MGGGRGRAGSFVCAHVRACMCGCTHKRKHARTHACTLAKRVWLCVRAHVFISKAFACVVKTLRVCHSCRLTSNFPDTLITAARSIAIPFSSLCVC